MIHKCLFTGSHGSLIETDPCRLDSPWGTETNPVEVTSHFGQRVVGVPDPYDDSIVWWDTIHAGQPPKQIIEDGEFFILKQLEGGGHGHH